MAADAEDDFDRPIYVIGRQHCGNTMLAKVLGNADGLYARENEGNYFDFRRDLGRDWPEDRGERVDRVLEIVHKNDTPPMPHESREEVREEVVRQLGESEDPEVGPDQIYRWSMAALARSQGARRWAQKATSYVFFVEDVLDLFPRARLVFLIRNPFDLSASKKRRESWGGVARNVWGWTRGVRLASRYEERFPERFLVTRYEDLVLEPEETVREIFEFIGEEYTAKVLDIPHVNRSETPYNTSSSETGMDDSRVYYYRDELTAEEIGAVGLLTPAELLGEYYPTIAGRGASGSGWRSLVEASSLVFQSGKELLRELGGKAARRPQHTVRRIYRRLFT